MNPVLCWFIRPALDRRGIYCKAPCDIPCQFPLVEIGRNEFLANRSENTFDGSGIYRDWIQIFVAHIIHALIKPVQFDDHGWAIKQYLNLGFLPAGDFAVFRG